MEEISRVNELTKKSHVDALRDLVPFVQLKKREKDPWRSVTSAINFTKGNTPPWVFFTFFKIVQMVPYRATHLKCKTGIEGRREGHLVNLRVKLRKNATTAAFI